MHRAPFALVSLILCLCAAAVQAQWVNYPTPGLPRGKDGKVLLNAPAPRTKEGIAAVDALSFLSLTFTTFPSMLKKLALN